MKSDWAVLAAGLRRNLAAGVRLALFLPVRALDFRVSPGSFAMLAGFNVLVALAGAFLRNGTPGHLDVEALPAVLGQFALVLAVALLVARIHRRAELTLALATALIASDWLFEAVGTAIQVAAELGAFGRLALGLGAASVAYLAWAFVVMIRALVVSAGWRMPRSLASAGVLAAMFLAFVLAFPRTELWVADEPEEEDELDAPWSPEQRTLHRQEAWLRAPGAWDEAGLRFAVARAEPLRSPH